MPGVKGNGVVFNLAGLLVAAGTSSATPAIQGAGLGSAIAVGSTPGPRTTVTSTIPVSPRRRARMSAGARR